VQCPWREVLYLVGVPTTTLSLSLSPSWRRYYLLTSQDSDSIPARDPEYMFDAPNYRRLGIWATPDYWKTSANNPIWAIIGVKCRNEWEMETGQMFIDKKLHLDTFFLIKYMLERHEWVRRTQRIVETKADKGLVVLLLRWRQRHLPLGYARPPKTMGRPRPMGRRRRPPLRHCVGRLLRAHHAPTRFMGRAPIRALQPP
jgi:hypothetical protein